MRKLLMLALTVLGVTAAQAVTINWTGTGTTEATTGTLSQTVSFADATKFYASVTLAGDSSALWNAATPGAARPDMVTLKDSNGATIMDINFRKEAGWYLQVNGTDHRLDGYLADITVVFEATKTEGTWGDIAVTVSGKSGTELKTLTGKITGTSIITDIASVVIGAPIANIAIGTVNVTVDNGVAVPEPTVLALLALGVAGMALKRKVA